MGEADVATGTAPAASISHAHRFSRRGLARALRTGLSLRKQEGAGKVGSWPLPWPACRKKSRRQSPQVRPTLPAFPARWCYDLYALFPGNGCLAPVAADSSSAAWHQHRDARTTRLPRRTGIVRPREQAHAAPQCAHRIPHPTSVTVAKRPSCGTGREDISIDSEKKK